MYKLNNKIISLLIIILACTSCDTGHASDISVKPVQLEKPEYTEIMNKIYGKKNYWGKYDCWLAEAQDQIKYCMAIGSAHQVDKDQKSYYYIQTSGAPVSESANITDHVRWVNETNSMHDELFNSDFDNAHAMGGGVGFFITDKNKKAILDSVSIMAYPSSHGANPGALEFWQISSTGDFAWFGKGGGVWQGIFINQPYIYTLKGNQVIDITGNIPGVNETNQDYEYSYKPITQTTGFYPIEITEISPKGKNRHFKAYFDQKYHCTDKVCTDKN